MGGGSGHHSRKVSRGEGLSALPGDQTAPLGEVAPGQEAAACGLPSTSGTPDGCSGSSSAPPDPAAVAAAVAAGLPLDAPRRASSSSGCSGGSSERGRGGALDLDLDEVLAEGMDLDTLGSGLDLDEEYMEMALELNLLVPAGQGQQMNSPEGGPPAGPGLSGSSGAEGGGDA